MYLSSIHITHTHHLSFHYLFTHSLIFSFIVHPPIHLSIIHSSVCPLFIHLSSIHPITTISSPIYPLTFLFHTSTCSSIVHPSTCIHPSICLSIYPLSIFHQNLIYPPIPHPLYLHPLSIHPCIHLSVYPLSIFHQTFIYQSIPLSIIPSIFQTSSTHYQFTFYVSPIHPFPIYWPTHQFPRSYSFIPHLSTHLHPML